VQARRERAQAEGAAPPPAGRRPSTASGVGFAPKCYGSCPVGCFGDLRFVNMTLASYQRSFLPDGARLWPPAATAAAAVGDSHAHAQHGHGRSADRLDGSANSCVAGDAPGWYKHFGGRPAELKGSTGEFSGSSGSG